MNRIRSTLWSCLVLFLLVPSTVLGQHGMEDEIPSKESWVVPYALVVLCIGLGVYIIAKPARRER